jgi:hypothetical protein
VTLSHQRRQCVTNAGLCCVECLPFPPPTANSRQGIGSVGAFSKILQKRSPHVGVILFRQFRGMHVSVHRAQRPTSAGLLVIKARSGPARSAPENAVCCPGDSSSPGTLRSMSKTSSIPPKCEGRANRGGPLRSLGTRTWFRVWPARGTRNAQVSLESPSLPWSNVFHTRTSGVGQ